MEKVKIVIVGAGMAGIAAAERLIAAGYTSVTILEGMDRVGGRIDTRPHGEGIIEMGAQWIHGEEHNPVFELARRNDLVDLAALADPDTDDEFEFYLSSGRYITRSVINETFMVLDNIFNEATRRRRRVITGIEFEAFTEKSTEYQGMEFTSSSPHIESVGDVTVGDATVGTYVRDAFYAYLRTSGDPEDAKRMKDGLFNWRMTMEKTENGCASVHDMSLCAWGEYVLCEGQEAVELSRGYRPVLDVILAHIPTDCFRLSTRVQQICWEAPAEGKRADGRGETQGVDTITGAASASEVRAPRGAEKSESVESGIDVNANKGINANEGSSFEVDLQFNDNDFGRVDLENALVSNALEFSPVSSDADASKMSTVTAKMSAANSKTSAANSKMSAANSKMSAAGGVSDRCTVVTTTGETFDADHVIVTCSLGCLKAHAAELFNPTLPLSKLSAIKRLGFGTVDKIYLEFEHPFWSEQCAGIELAWLPNDDLTLKCLKDRAEDEYTGGEWYKGIHGFDIVALHSNLLCGWIAGTEAEVMETLSDDLVLSVCHELLQTFTGTPDAIERPSRIIRTNWFANDCTLGSYSYRHTGSSVADSLELGRALPSDEEPRLLFAGEATHATFFSTTHGAMLTGQREADRIIAWHGGPAAAAGEGAASG